MLVEPTESVVAPAGHAAHMDPMANSPMERYPSILVKDVRFLISCVVVVAILVVSMATRY
jgi:hypothetical protein